MSFILLGILNSQAAAGGAANAYDLLETVSLGSDTSSVTFSNINTYTSTYKHLQLRITTRQAGQSSDSIERLRLRFNSDTAANYSSHRLFGEGFSPSSESTSGAGGTGIDAGLSPAITDGQIRAANIIDIFDFGNTTTYKTTKTLFGFIGVGQRQFGVHSGSWRSTAQITSINLGSRTGTSLAGGSRLSLYGIRG